MSLSLRTRGLEIDVLDWRLAEMAGQKIERGILKGKLPGIEARPGAIQSLGTCDVHYGVSDLLCC